MIAQINPSKFSKKAYKFYMRAVAFEKTASLASEETSSYPKNLIKIAESAHYYGLAVDAIKKMIETMPEKKRSLEMYLWLHDTDAIRYHCLGDLAYYSGDYANKVLYHEKSAEAQQRAIDCLSDLPADEQRRSYLQGKKYYVMADALDGIASPLEEKGQWQEALKLRTQERELKEKELECMQKVMPAGTISHHASRVWAAERSRLQCMIEIEKQRGDLQKMMELLSSAAYAAERARQASPDWTPYGQASAALQRELQKLISSHPELVKDESIDALIIKYLGKGLENRQESVDDIIHSLEQVAARKRKHLIPRCYKIGTPFCPYRAEETQKQVFIGMPFQPEYENAYRFAVAPALTDVGLIPWKANDTISNIDIMCKMCYAIQQSPYAVVNISEWNPNVMFELGLLYAQKKNVLLIKDSKRDVPVDLSGLEYVEYDRFDSLQEKIASYFTKAIAHAERPGGCFKIGSAYCPCATTVHQDSTQVFIAMPFKPDHENTYQYAILPSINEVGLKPWKANEIFSNIDLMIKVCQAIQTSLYGIVDITGWNPNVMFELGLLYGFGKKVVLLKHRKDEVPADLRGLEYVEYDDYEKLKTNMVSFLRSFFS